MAAREAIAEWPARRVQVHMITELESVVDTTKYVIKGRTFQGSSFDLAGMRFEDCHFIQCQFIYQGDPFVDFTNCTFKQCDWVVDGPAENTLVFLSKVYRGFGDEGRNLVESVFNSIRDGTV